ncbi:MAG: metallophosphoesterase [Bacteroidales bacterium]|nr:metallophosphoesterase [Bacteroidales bacterium]
MANRFAFVIIFLIVFTILVDLYAFLAIHNLVKNQDSTFKLIVTVAFWAVTFLFLVVFLYFFRIDFQQRNPSDLSGVFILVGLYFLVYLPKIVFISFRAVEDLVWFVSWIAKNVAGVLSGQTLNVSRMSLISKTGLVLSLVPFIAILSGIVSRFNFHINKVEISMQQLPDSLNGLKIVHISDIHLGSIYGKQKKVQKAVDMINAADADLVLFTGDLVNNFSEEAVGWEQLFASVGSRYGKYSILGNHDYGDYWNWNTAEEKAANMQMLLKIQNQMGFKLLRNAWDTVQINGERIGLIGVENWGLPPFSQHGDLKAAMQDLPPVGFKVLLSHNPTHWDAEVLEKTDIPLTLSGHTHAMQFAIRFGNFRWSPARIIYNRYMGLYCQNGQALYVNSGLGYIGFPGRVGIRPEITLITLKSEHD